MAKAAGRASSLTTLTVGQVEVAVGLFPAHQTPGALVKFATAGPNGGVLKAQAMARAVPIAEDSESPEVPVHSDPLASDPGPEKVPVVLDDSLPSHTIAGPAQVDGEYGRQLVEEGTGEVVKPEDVRRGLRLDDGRFIDCTTQLAEIETQTKLDRMAVVAFVDASRIHRARTVRTYYLGAADERAPKPLRLIYEALRSTRRAAIVKLTKQTRQTLGAIVPFGKTLVLYELVWAEDFRDPPAKALLLQKAHVSDREVAAACALINAMGDGVESSLNVLRDDAVALREELHAKALAGEVPEVLTPSPVLEEQNVMAQLEASLAAVA